MNKCFSTNGENFHDDEYLVIGECESEGLTEVSVGESVPKQHSDFLSISHMIDCAQEAAQGDVGEIADDYLENLTLADHGDLKKLITNFLDERIGEPSFYGVNNIREIPLAEFLATYCKE